MDMPTIKGNWNKVAGKLKLKYANLTDDDLLFKEGKEEELIRRLQKDTRQNESRSSQTTNKKELAHVKQ